MACSNTKLSSNNLSIKILNKTVNYNSDTIQYYILNEGDNDVRLVYNPEFFKREKDSLIMDTWFNPQITILNDNIVVFPQVYSVDYFEKIRDSLQTIRNARKDYQEFKKIKDNKLYNRILKDYSLIIKKHDSVKFSTKINFEGESRFYDLNKQIGYILKKNKTYKLKICINENLNPEIRRYLKKENIYNEEICSNQIKLIFIKTNYSDE